ncbi:MAG: phage portal protein, partial [bacterium]
MAWNAKRLDTATQPSEKTVVRGTHRTMGSQVAYNENWDNKRAIADALQRVTWVYRAVDAIASNAARLPIVLREDDPYEGETVDNFSLYKLLNSTPNAGEDSVAFRYRLSSQLLLSDKGVFVEITRNRAGQVLALTLLPPDAMNIIPDTKKFVAGYELKMEAVVNGRKQLIEKKYKPSDVIWIRKPHPFNPYGAITPLAAAGVAIESDWYAKMYNRNFLLNDGRPGGLVVVKGDMTEEDKDELRAKFGGSINRAGRISVIASDDGADFVDTAVTPRDAQYIDGRRMNKDEILMAFGVPESVLANAAGRTFDNAEMERHVFWMETMIPHMDLLTRPLDQLDPNDSTFISYDLSRVDVLQRMEMKRREFILREYDGGAISVDEYRDSTGRTVVDTGRSRMLWISKSKLPTVTTDGETPEDVGFELDEAPTAGRPPENGVDEEPEDDPVEREDERMTPLDNTDTTPAGTQETASEAPEIQTKTLEQDLEEEIRTTYWFDVSDAASKRLIERAARVLGEKANGHKFR